MGVSPSQDSPHVIDRAILGGSTDWLGIDIRSPRLSAMRMSTSTCQYNSRSVITRILGMSKIAVLVTYIDLNCAYNPPIACSKMLESPADDIPRKNKANNDQSNLR